MPFQVYKSGRLLRNTITCNTVWHEFEFAAFLGAMLFSCPISKPAFPLAESSNSMYCGRRQVGQVYVMAILGLASFPF